MTGVTSLDRHHNVVEEVAGHLAYQHYRDGYFMRDIGRAWRSFAALKDLRFFSSRDGRDWERRAIFDPIEHAGEVAAYFQPELDRIRLY